MESRAASGADAGNVRDAGLEPVVLMQSINDLQRTIYLYALDAEF
jgi:hypothetical protein